MELVVWYIDDDVNLGTRQCFKDIRVGIVDSDVCYLPEAEGMPLSQMVIEGWRCLCQCSRPRMAPCLLHFSFAMLQLKKQKSKTREKVVILVVIGLWK